MTETVSNLEDDYAGAGFGQALAFGKRPALLVIDVVQAYLRPDSPLYGAPFEAALQANRRLVTAAQRLGYR